MAESWLTRPIGDLPFTKASWWTQTTPRDPNKVEAVDDPLAGSFLTGPGEALGRIAEQRIAASQPAMPTQPLEQNESAEQLGERLAREGRLAQADPYAGLSAKESIAKALEVPGLPSRTPQEGPVAPTEAQVPIAAVSAARAREAGLPPNLRPKFGTYFGPDYLARVDEAEKSGQISPSQAKSARSSYEGFLSSPLGIVEQQMSQLGGHARNVAELQLEQMDRDAQLSERASATQAKFEQQAIEDEQKFKDNQKQLEAELVGRKRELDAIRADIAATKIDPQNYFSSQPSWAKVLSLISVAVGGFASGWSGGKIPNSALQQLNAAIDRDIEAQKANLEKKRGVLGAAESVYGKVRQQLGDDQQAYLFTSMLLKEKAKNAALALASEGRTENIRTGAKILHADLDNAIKMDGLRVLELHSNAFVEAQRRAAASAYSAKTAAEREYEKAMALKKKELELKKAEYETEKLGREIGVGMGGAMPADSKDVATFVPGLGGFAGTPEQAQKANELLQDIEMFEAGTNELIALKSGNHPLGDADTSPKARARFNSIGVDVRGNLRQFQKAGTIDKGQKEEYENKFPEAGVFSPDAPAIEALKVGLDVSRLVRSKLRQNSSIVPGRIETTPRGPVKIFEPSGAPPALDVRPYTPSKSK